VTVSADATIEITYDPYAPEMREDPWETFRLLRDHAPVYHNAERDLWVISRHEDVRETAKDWERFSSAKGVTILLDAATGKISPTPVGPGDFLEMDPPMHDKLRALVRARFTPQAINALEPTIRRIANELIDEFIEAGEVDIASNFGCQLPASVITHMLGLPLADVPDLSRWFSQATDPPAPGQDPDEWSQTMIQGAGNMWMHLAAALEDRKQNPRDDILTDLANASLDDGPLGDQAVGMCFLLYAAGEDTTVGLLTTAIRTLDESPDHRRWLLEFPDKTAQAVDELLRYDGPFLHLTRVTTQDVNMHDVTIPADARVLLLWASANRDERQYEQPDVLDFDRGRIAHLGFGHGLHHCLGSALAKVEGRVALEVLLSRLPDYRISGPLAPGKKPFVRGYRGIPATFTPGPRVG
jgi:cytochrome P450